MMVSFIIDEETALPGIMTGRNETAGEGSINLGRVRDDALPENLQYRDDGCEVHPHCLSCPLPRCRYEEPGGLRALLNRDRDFQIRRLRGSGVAVELLARRFGVSRRTVFRALEKGHDEQPAQVQTGQRRISNGY